MARSTLRTTDELPTNTEAACGQVIDLGEELSPGHTVLRPTDVAEGMEILVNVDTGPLSAYLRDNLVAENDEGRFGLQVDVDEVRYGFGDDEGPTDIYGDTLLGQRVHIYPRRGKVVLNCDDPSDQTTLTIVNTFGYPVRTGFCYDGTTCGCTPSHVVSVGGVEVAHCGHHGDQAAELAADVAGVDLDEEPTRLRDGHSPDPSPDDYDVTDTREALRQQDTTERCDQCDRPLVGDGDGGLQCPTGRHGAGEVVTDGGHLPSDQTEGPKPTRREDDVPRVRGGFGGYDAGMTHAGPADADPDPNADRTVLRPTHHARRYAQIAPTHGTVLGSTYRTRGTSYGLPVGCDAPADGYTAGVRVGADGDWSDEATTPSGWTLRGSPTQRRLLSDLDTADVRPFNAIALTTEELVVWYPSDAGLPACAAELVADSPFVVTTVDQEHAGTPYTRFTLKRGGD
jgi:hypothetical protein